MKRKQTLSLVLTTAMTFSLLVTPAAAGTFSDLSGRYSWAASYAEDLAEKGIVQGKGNGKYDPSGTLTAVEVFVFCARMMGLTDSQKSAMLTARSAEIDAVLPQASSWAAPELAVCLETGVLTGSELKTLCSTGNIRNAMVKEDLAYYLVRAMQLENAVSVLDTYALAFSDASSISSSRKAYVYLLNQYGVVQGTDDNQFQPKSTVDRAVMATMVSKAMNVMQTKGIAVDLPNYSDYDWVAGNVVSLTTDTTTTVTLKLNSDASGETSLSMSQNVGVYLDHVKTDLSAISAGRYAKVELNSAGTPVNVYLTSALTSYSGVVSAVSDTGVTISFSGTSKTFPLDRCTEVKVGSKAGDVSIIDSTTGYTNAVVRVEGSGRAAVLTLSGGTRKSEGLITSVVTVSGKTAVNLINLDGESTSATLDSGAAVTVNGNTGLLSTSYVGKYASVIVRNDDDLATTVAIRTDSNYIYGYVKTIAVTTANYSITVKRFDTGNYETFKVDDSAAVTYDGRSVTFKSLSAGRTVILELNSKNLATSIYSFTDTTVTEGTLSEVNFDTVTTLTVTCSDGTKRAFSIDLQNDSPSFERNDKTSTLDRLTVGDTVTITTRYNKVSKVASYSQQATTAGTVSSISTDLNGTTLIIKLDTGETKSFSVAVNAVVTKDEKTVTLSTVQPGDAVDLVVSGDELTAITVTSSKTTSSELNGTILSVDTKNRTLLCKSGDGSLFTVSVSTSARVVSATGTFLALGDLKAGDTVQLFGSYSGSQYLITLIVQK